MIVCLCVLFYIAIWCFAGVINDDDDIPFWSNASKNIGAPGADIYAAMLKIVEAFKHRQ